MLKLILTISFIFCAYVAVLMIFNTAYAAIGNVVQYEGIASVERDEEKVSLEKDSDIFFKDNVLTGNGNVGITFVDDTNVAISPHSS